ncbi:MAG TPA: efflux RND transporter periplasmic adaptor subunit [Prolixibacteraceae bacterium]|nr:efflux RND transporter periplasmic adaptor subunit [Prolixibacteraceae bacterium]
MTNKKRLTTLVILVAIAAFIIYTFILLLKKEPLVVQGEVEATQVKISSKVPGRIDSIAVKRGQQVTKGDLIFTISSPEIDAKLAQVNALKQAASAQKQKAYNGAQKEDIEAAYSTYIKAEAAAQLAEKTYKRVQNLFNDGVVPEQNRDEAETQMKAARETSNAAKAVWEKAKNGARNEDKAAAAALVEQAEGAIAEVESYLKETSINALISGEVSGINIEKGELVPTGFPVVTIYDLSDTWVTFFIREDLLNEFQLGKTFKAALPGMGNKVFDFNVTYVSAAGDFARWNATKTSGDFDLKSFQIEARPVSKIDGLRPGMTVIVTIPKK